MILKKEYLALRQNRLRRLGDWVPEAQGVLFLLVTGGKGVCGAGLSQQPLRAGDVVVFSSASSTSLQPDQGDGIVFWSFSAQIQHLFPLFANEEVWLLQDLESRFKTGRIYAASTPVARECHRLVADAPPQFSLEHRSHLLRVAATVLSVELRNARPTNEAYVPLEEHLNSIFDNLSTEDILSLSIDELATCFSCSRRHLNRLFHHRFGLSVSALRMELRLLKAASLLRDASAKIINVAEQCGFNHLGLFNTCFKRRFDSTPGDWRRQSAQKKPSSIPYNGSSTGQCTLHANGLCPWGVNSPVNSTPGSKRPFATGNGCQRGGSSPKRKAAGSFRSNGNDGVPGPDPKRRFRT